MPATHTQEPSSPGADLNAARESLVARMIEQLRGPGYFLAQIDAHAGQLLADLRWAAQLAGRAVGRPTRTYAGAAGDRHPGVLTVVVAPVETFAASGPTDEHSAFAMIANRRCEVRGGGKETD